MKQAFPAHAGMNRNKMTYREIIKGVPRTRGDEPTQYETIVTQSERSPHTRG